jgi:PKD repeat protein
VGRSGIAVLAVATALAVVPAAHATAVATFTVTPDAALIGTTFVFDASGSQGVRFQWDLDGDGTYETDTGYSKQATKTYTGAGTITARLLVTDSDDSTAQYTQTFTVLAPASPEPTQEDVTAPVISGVTITPKAFRLAPRATPINAVITKKAVRGGKLTWTLSEPANLAVYIERCASKKTCNPHVVTVKMHRSVPAGTRSVPFTGRVELRRLSPGGYRFKLTATDDAGNFSVTRYAPFVVLPG